jgi:hypothetical protein
MRGFLTHILTHIRDNMKQPAAGIIYRGPSLLDGTSIVVIGVYNTKGANTKTGAVLQTYILCDSGMSPSMANYTGADYAICGGCKHRGIARPGHPGKVAPGRTCYVQMTGPSAVWGKYQRGGYPDCTAKEGRQTLARERFLRMGTYGDPGAVPYKVWEHMLGVSAGHTAYTHQAMHQGAQPMPGSMMFSADTQEEAASHQRAGARTFRVIPVKVWQAQGKQALMPSEILCPASKEAGARVTCLSCKLCSGANVQAKSITVVAHGATRGNV